MTVYFCNDVERYISMVNFDMHVSDQLVGTSFTVHVINQNIQFVLDYYIKPSSAKCPNK